MWDNSLSTSLVEATVMREAALPDTEASNPKWGGIVVLVVALLNVYHDFLHRIEQEVIPVDLQKLN